ncbi:NUDIX domain-containing protein [Actinomadura darangshiensis]|uniref:NUDIX domain-containing protein n=1 Tax=Actinomadura darangshiensis TaxID=705336 RepID=A0A4R5AEX6_9ACTN|nr:NUDIX domain-containing protein [Actinomadura darangshiensis]TDD69404.1 NUDIX domain-containing protein [Actinomadura darangshiensis]
MGRRVDYYDDPDAPEANSIVPSVNVIAANEDGEILLILRADNDNWALPGGAVDLGESVRQAAIRETREETGISCEIVGIVGIYSDPRHVIRYTSNEEVRQEFSIVLTGRPIGGRPTPSDESREVHWMASGDIKSLRMDRSMRLRIDHYLEGRKAPFIL